MPKLSALTAKAAPTTADELIITDKADSNNTKRITANNLPLSAAAVSGLAAKLNLSGGTMTGILSLSKVSPEIRFNDTDSSGDDFRIIVDNNAFIVQTDRDGNSTYEDPKPLRLEADTNTAYTFGNEIVTLDGSGNLGVGTSSPNHPVDIKANSSSWGLNIIGTTLNDSGFIRFTESNGTTTTSAIGVNVAGALQFDIGAAERMRLDSSGNLGVGTSSPNNNVHVHSSSNISRIQITNNTCGSSASDGSAITSVDNELQIVNQEGGYISFGTSNAERMRLDSSGNLLVGKTTAALDTQGSHITAVGQAAFIRDGGIPLTVNRRGSDGDVIYIMQGDVVEGTISVSGTQLQVNGSGSLGLQTGGTTRAIIDGSGNLLVGKTDPAISAAGHTLAPSGLLRCARAENQALEVNRLATDGDLVHFLQNNTIEGSISVSGTTVSYNGGHLARWSRMLDGSKPENLLKGTVMTNLDEMIEWAYDETPEVLWAAGDGLPEGVSVGDVKVEGVEATYWGEMGENVPEFAGDIKLGDVKTEAVEEVLWTETDGLPEGVSIGDVKVEYKPAGVEDNEQLNHTAISSVEGDKDVAGVFIAWDDDDEYNDYNLAMVGDVIIRIAEGVEVKRGDLLVSAGDGTAKPLDPEAPLTVSLQAAIVAKVTSTHVTCVYDDGSFCIPCVLK